MDTIGTATYSPDDNKIRITPFRRLDKEIYERVRAAGYAWAPKQEIFVAPMWTPSREDLAIELCGEIDDEDTSLTERAEARAERFEDYSEKRGAEAESARQHVSAIADNIPFGQPILVGHHSEKRARRDAEKIENGMRRAVKLWETSEYWTRRAAGALAHAKYKELPSVRARRIKRLEAEKRKVDRNKAQAEKYIRYWSDPQAFLKKKDGTKPTMREAVLFIAEYNRGDYLAEYERPNGYKGPLSMWEAAGGNIDGKDPEAVAIATPEQICERGIQQQENYLPRVQRWIDHYTNRLEYERAMLAESGGTAADKKGPEKGGAVKCWVCSNRSEFLYIVRVNKVSVSVADNWGNGGRNFPRVVPFDKLREVMSAAEVTAARTEGRLHENAFKTGFIVTGERPAEPAAAKEEPAPEEDKAADFEGMRASLKAGVQVVSAPQLFPTPAALAARMVELADIQKGESVLEPSAGTGAIIKALPADQEITAVEINNSLAQILLQYDRRGFYVRQRDFLELTPSELGTYDKILMNPPFENGSDIKHIRHALQFLKPGGRLVAICANGPRQKRELMALPQAVDWEDLPRGTFSNQGTEVNTALLVIEGGAV